MKVAPLFSGLQTLSRHTARPMSRDKADALLLLATCLLVLLPHISHLPIWVFPVCASLLAWRAWVTFRGNRMPSMWILLPVALLAMAGVYATYKTFFGRDAGVAMLTLLLALKLLEMHAKRDLFVVLFLSFFLILSSFFYSQSIGTAVLTVCAVIAILTTQLSFQYTGAIPPLKQRLRLGATILALAVPLTLVLFLLFPRIQGPLWGLPSDAHAGRTGLSETMAPGNISKLALSEDIAFRVKFVDQPPEKSNLYWRGVVLGNYDGRTWTPLRSGMQSSRQITLNLRGTPVRYQVTLEPHGRHWLFALEVPQAVPEIASNPANVTYALELMSSQPINERVRYDAISHINFDLQPNENALVLRQWLALPRDSNPRTLTYANRLRSQSNDPAKLITAVLHHFREQNFRYTLEPPSLGKHVIDEFLFDTRAGFCEHYSSAFVVLMRMLGIPSRVVTGYQGGEINEADGFMTVRQSDAHAWAEVWLENRGWIRVDPTAAVAPNRVEQNLSSVLPRQFLGGLISLDATQNAWVAQWLKLRNSWEAVANGWNQWVLNYTPEKQKDLIKSFGFDNADWRTMALIMVVLGVFATAISVLPLMLRQQKCDPLDVIYVAFCRRMEKQGFPRAMHEGPQSYRERLSAAGSSLPMEQKAAFARFLQFYEEARYGTAKGAPSSAISQLKRLLSECR